MHSARFCLSASQSFKVERLRVLFTSHLSPGRALVVGGYNEMISWHGFALLIEPPLRVLDSCLVLKCSPLCPTYAQYQNRLPCQRNCPKRMLPKNLM